MQSAALPTAESDARFIQLVRLADDHLILGHRLSEWCGHAPMLEEDLAMPNIALDLLGQARALYSHAGIIENKDRDEDALAYRRLEREYTNLLMCERPNGDFAHTMLRQLFFSVFMKHYWLSGESSSDPVVAALASKAQKESDYHVRHCAQWVIRLGDGTDESAARLAKALQALTPYLHELFESDSVTQTNGDVGFLPEPSTMQTRWRADIDTIFDLAKLCLPSVENLLTQGKSGGRQGLHSESMGFLLAELQFLQRTYPNMQW